MKRSARCLLALAPFLFSSGAAARDLPNFDATGAAAAVKVAALPGQPPPAAASSMDARRGVPTFLWAGRTANASTLPISGLTPEAAARAHLARHAARYGLTPAALATAKLHQVHDTGRGGIIVVLRQAPGGIEVFHNDIKILLDRSLALVAIGGNLHASAVAKPKTAGFLVGEADAIAAAFKDLYGIAVPATALVDRKQTKADYHYYDLGSTPALQGTDLRFVEPARVKRVYFPLPDRLVPAYFLELQSGKIGDVTPDAYGYVIAADDGRLLYRENLTHHDVFNYRVYADATGDHRPMDGPIADFSPHPTGVPDGSAPAFASPNLISIDGFNKFHDPWLPIGATQTLGNNVDAYTDDDKPDGFSGGTDIRATTTATGTFDRTYDTSLGPQVSDNQKMASITSLFYTTNWLHDWWYDSGFDEAAGNAQGSNFGRGGIGGDALHAEAQDGAPGQRNNSNMSPMSDGASPRMQMFVWDGIASTILGVQPLNQNLPNGVAGFGPQSFNVSGTLVLATDGTAPVNDICQNVTNGGAVSGKIAVIDRGTCSFSGKVTRAQQAGAIGVIIVDNVAGEAAPFMGGGGGGANLPVMSVSLNDGNALKAAMMSGPVTVTMNRGATVDRDGTLDNTVVAHEWGHYIHLRQVFGGSAALSAESEGWGDFFALHTLVRQGDNLDGAFAMAQYVTVSFPDDPNYFGIRRYPYSVDFTKNALTFKHITDGEALPAGVPVAQSTAQVNNAEPHAAGEIWASMLFEAYIALLKKSQAPGAPYDFTAARRRMSDYVEGGLKLAPLDPTYTEQRDAILAAAAAADLDDLQVLAAAFARRGAGTCAVSPARDSTDFSGVVESFTVQPNLSITSVTIDDSVKSCDNDGQLDAEETGKVTVMVLNTGTAPVTNATATVVSTAPGISFPSGVTLSFGTLPPFGAATATVDIAMAGTITKMENVDLQVTLDGAASCAAQSFTTSPLANFDEVPGSSNVDHVETVSTAWKLDGDGADTIWTRTEQPGGNHVWTGIDYSSPSDTSLVSPPVTVAASGNFVLTFDHRYSFEQSMGVNWDGSLIEISGDGGGTWEDISTYGAPGYTGTIGDPQGQAQNALINRDGYVGESAAYPAMETVTIDLGTAFANKTVQVRFRIGTDDAAGANGWDVDNIQFDGITAQPFGSLIDDKASCGMPPFANAGPDQVVLSGQFVGLDGTQSKDPQNLPLTFAWEELSGAPVTLTGADTAKPTFNAPAVAASTTLTFQLTVSDGSLSATDTIDVIVTPDGGGPDAGPGPDGGVADGGADAGADGGDSGEAIAFGGCGCETKSGPGNAGAAFSLLGLAALFTRRRRSAKA